MCWYEKRFPEGCVELRPHGGLNEFAEVFAVFAQTCAGAAVFSARDARGGVTIYFPPVARDFACMIRANAAPKPRREGLVALCGGRRALESWFGSEPVALHG